MLHLLIDAYNLMYSLEKNGKLKDSKGRSLGLDLKDKRKSMISLLQEYRATREVQISLVFDSSQPQYLLAQRTKVGKIQIIFTDEDQTADEHICLECEKRPGKYVVVSSDLEVIRGAEAHQCLSLRSEEFIQKLKLATSELYQHPDLEGKDDSGPLYPKVSTRKKGVAKKLSKNKRRKRNFLKNL